MTASTLVLSPRFHGDSQDLWRAAIARGWNVHRAIRYQGPERTGQEVLEAAVMTTGAGQASVLERMLER